jgi:predicted ABC-type ATPase
LKTPERAGYAIELVYVGTADVAINLQRIRQRVAAGGHDVPEADVLRRAKRSFDHAPEIVPLADNIAIFDNSGDEMLPIVTFEDGVVSEYRAPPAWAEAIVAAVRARANSGS